jgi:glycerol-3-phosphate dehydrogenase
MTIACLFADVLGWDKNSGLSGNDRLPGSNVWKPTSLYPGEERSKRVPAIGWWDAVLSQPHRLIASLVGKCNFLGIRLVNHARVTELVVDKDKGITAVQYQRMGDDAPSRLDVRAVVDASGHGGRSFRRRIPAIKRECDWVGAANFLLDEQPSSSCAIGLRARECYGVKEGAPELGKWRDFFFVPTPSGLLAGTTYTFADPDAEPALAKSLAYEQLMDEINRARPDREVSAANIKHFFWGLLPATIAASGSASSRLLGRDLIVDGAKEYGLPGYYRVQGVKLTTAFELAYRVVPMLLRYRSTVDRGGLKASTEVASSVETMAPTILMLASPSELKTTLGSMTGDEIRDIVSHCVRREYAQTLEDLLQRRLGLLPCDYPDEQLCRSLAQEMAAQLGWDESRVAKEVKHAESLVAKDPTQSFELAASSPTAIRP